MTTQKEYTASLRRIYEAMETEVIRHQALNLDGKEELRSMLEDFAGEHDFHFSYCSECGAINKQTVNGDCGPCLSDENEYKQYLHSLELGFRQAKGW